MVTNRLFGARPMSPLRSGWAAVEYEIAEERASALGRPGRRLEAALAALAACSPTEASDRQTRDGLVAEAGYALWLFIVQREACGLNDSRHVMQTYGWRTRYMPAWGRAWLREIGWFVNEVESVPDDGPLVDSMSLSE
jgi:hypothetical protein